MNVLNITRQLIKNLAVAIFTAAVLVSEALAEVQENLYQIEFILFKQATPDLPVLEFEKATADIPVAGDFLTVFPYLTDALSRYQRAGLNEMAELSLAGQTERLDKKGYAVLAQGAWQERLANDSRSLPVRLSSEERPFDCPFWSWVCSVSKHAKQTADTDAGTLDSKPQEQFHGQLTIRRSRYMHAEVHLDYYFKRPVMYKSLLEYLETPFYGRAPVSALLVPQVQTSELESLNIDEQSGLINVKSFTFKQSRRVKNNEIHYLDHPYLGMIVSIKRIEQSDYP